ncbi:MAG: hypothetical protein K5643_09885, partial [Saccharofermentans sp.]|nr:hypothetical protein [Saccharofermentans sp.]
GVTVLAGTAVGVAVGVFAGAAVVGLAVGGGGVVGMTMGVGLGVAVGAVVGVGEILGAEYDFLLTLVCEAAVPRSVPVADPMIKSPL